MNTLRYPLSQVEGLKCLKIAINHNDQIYKHQALLLIGVTHWQAGAYAEAIDHLTQAYELQKSLGDYKNCTETLRYLGAVFLKNEQREKAAESYQQALELLHAMNDRQARAHVLLDIGYMHWSHNEYNQAHLAYEEVRQIAIEIGDQRTEANALTSLGSLSSVKGDYENSLKYLQEAAVIHQRIGNVRVYGLDLNNMGAVYLSLGQHEKAEISLEKAQKTFEGIQWESWEAYALAKLGELHSLRNEFDRALDFLSQAKEIYLESKNQRELGVTLRNLGEIYRDCEKYLQALENLEQALVIARALGSTAEEMQVLSSQGLTYLKMSEIGNAIASSLRALEILKKMRRFPQAQQILYAHHQVLTAAALAQDARRFLHKAHRALLHRAKRIQNIEFRTSFLNNVPVHREILETYERTFRHLGLSDAECYELLRKLRWPNEITSPCCGSLQIRVHGQVSHSSEKRYVCMKCRKTFSDRTGTVFAHKNLLLSKLFQALVLISHATDEASTVQALTRTLEVHARTATNIYQELGAALREDSLLQQLVQQLQKRTR
ncbi:tetratricopeptide repeat protein [Candidatus Acetothermia bacterium]|nr:tetratricopeptide repeat protein [Candidatus Acetothermia bacterium]